LFKFVRIFYSRQMPVVSKTLADFQSISNISSAAFEWHICLDLVAKSGLMTSSHFSACSVGYQKWQQARRLTSSCSSQCGYQAFLFQAWSVTV